MRPQAPSLGVSQQEDESAHRAAWPATIAQLVASHAKPPTAGSSVPNLVFQNGAACVTSAAMEPDGEGAQPGRCARGNSEWTRAPPRIRTPS